MTKIIRLARSVSARRQPEKVSQKLNDELLHRLGQLGVISGNSAGDNGVAGDLSQLFEQLANLSVVSAGDLECSVNEQICAVVVGSQNAGNEAVECVNALYCIVLDVDKANLRGDVGVEGEPFWIATTLPLDLFSASWIASIRILVLPVPLLPVISLIIVYLHE